MSQLVFFATSGLFFGILVTLIGSTLVAAVFLARDRRSRAEALPFLAPVSVLIPAYNEGKNIGRCLDAVFANGYPREKLEVIVVDDGSSDATHEVAGAYPGVRRLRQEHGGKVKALNMAVESATHEVLVCIDADTVLAPGAIARIVEPLADPGVGAVIGVAKVGNRRGLLGWFQSMEYLTNAFSRESFAAVFQVTAGVCGAFTGYWRSALRRIGGFKPDTAAEDYDVALDLASRGFAVRAVRGAVAYTEVPETFSALFRQRVRWMKGCMQCYVKHRALLASGRPGLAYVVAAQTFWIVYALLSLPLIAFSFLYWLPLDGGSWLDAGFYVVRWGSLVGPVYMVLKIPEWGVSPTYFFGVLAGLLSPLLMLGALLRYDRLRLGSLLVIFFYFPYTLLLSAMMVGSLAAYIRSRGKGAFLG